MSVRVSKHAKERAGERLNVNYKSKRNQLFNRALRYGHPPNDFAGEFRDYLDNKKKKQKSIGIKVYDKNIYIYKNRLVITVFPVPEKYLPIDEQYASYIKDNPYLMKLYKIVNREDIALEVVQKDNESVVTGLSIGDEFQCFGVGKNEIKSRNNAIKTYLRSIEKLEDCEDIEGD
jgi:hypothetical protein